MRRFATSLITLGVAGFALAGCGGGGNPLVSSTTAPATTAPATTAPATTAPASTGTSTSGGYTFLFRDFVGAWSGSVGRSDSGTDYVLKLTFDSPPDEAPGRAEIRALDCTGAVPYERYEADGRYVFRLDWEPGACTDGTIWLKPLGPTTIAYHWEDGQGNVSDTTLTRG